MTEVSPKLIGVTESPWFCNALSGDRTNSSLMYLSLKPPRITVPPSPGKSFRANPRLKFGAQAKPILGAKLFLSLLKNCPGEQALPPTKSKVQFRFNNAALGS